MVFLVFIHVYYRISVLINTPLCLLAYYLRYN